MRLTESGAGLTEGAIGAVEGRLGLRFPAALRECYLRANGGVPDPHVYGDDRVDTVVSAFLPLVGEQADEEAVHVYQHLVRSLRLVPETFFPFAVDGGGDYFFVDCESRDADVYLYRHDTAFEPLVPLSIGLTEFWTRLKEEDS